MIYEETYSMPRINEKRKTFRLSLVSLLHLKHPNQLSKTDCKICVDNFFHWTENENGSTSREKISGSFTVYHLILNNIVSSHTVIFLPDGSVKHCRQVPIDLKEIRTRKQLTNRRIQLLAVETASPHHQ